MTTDDTESHSRLRPAILPLAGLLLLVTGASALAQNRPTAVIQSVRAGYPVLEATTANGDRNSDASRRRVRLGAWTPVWVELRGGSTSFKGRVEVACPDDDDIPIVTQISLDLPANAAVTVSGLVRPGSSRPSLNIRLVPDDPKISPSRPTNWPLEPPLSASRLLVLGAGRTPGLTQVAGLLKFQGARGGLAIGTLDELPSAWYGLDGVEAVALATADPEAAPFLQPDRVQTLRDWVAQGGHLVISLGGSNWQQAASALGDLLPAQPLGPLTLAEISDLGALESFAGNVSRPIPPPLDVVRLETAVNRPATVTLAAVAATPLVVRGAYGFGRVTVLALDVSQPPFSTWPDRPLVWDRLLDLQIRGSDSSAIAGTSRGALIQQANPDLAARLHQALGSFPGVKLIPFGWVALLIFVYLLAIGPLDYYLLRHVFRRMEMTWLTFPLIVGLTSAVAFAAAHALKGNDLRVNKLDFLDVDQSRGTLRGQSWVTAFSPGNLDYRVSINPLSPQFRPQPLAAPSLQSNTLSWFGPPEAGLSGVGRVALGNRRSLYAPPNQLAQLNDVRIPIWSTKSFVGRWAGTTPGTRLIEVELRTVAGDRLAGSVRNMLDLPLRDARLFYGRNVYELGNIRPRGIARVNPTRTEAASRHLSRLLQSADKRPAGGASTAGTPEDRAALRVELLRAALFRNTLGTRADDYPSFPLRKLDLTDHANELRRPILVAEVDDPAATLNLEGWSGEPERTQSTILRVILSLDDPAIIDPLDDSAATPTTP